MISAHYISNVDTTGIKRKLLGHELVQLLKNTSLKVIVLHRLQVVYIYTTDCSDSTTNHLQASLYE